MYPHIYDHTGENTMTRVNVFKTCKQSKAKEQLKSSRYFCDLLLIYALTYYDDRLCFHFLFFLVHFRSFFLCILLNIL